jgi:hypothetical protein
VSFKPGGCDFAEDPKQDVREVQPVWLPDPPTVVRVIRDHEAGTAARLSVWSLPGRKAILHDGRHLRLGCSDSNRAWRLSLSTDLADGDPFAFVAASGSDLRAQWSVISDFTQFLKADSSASHRARVAYPSRSSIVHLRALQALDGFLVGAPQREIGTALFGSDAVAQRWLSDGELRAQVRHLIRRGRALMSGGYRGLLQNCPEGKGDSGPPPKSP